MVHFRRAGLPQEEFVFFYIDMFGRSLDSQNAQPWARGDQDDLVAKEAFQVSLGSEASVSSHSSSHSHHYLGNRYVLYSTLTYTAGPEAIIFWYPYVSPWLSLVCCQADEIINLILFIFHSLTVKYFNFLLNSLVSYRLSSEGERGNITICFVTSRQCVDISLISQSLKEQNKWARGLKM